MALALMPGAGYRVGYSALVQGLARVDAEQLFDLADAITPPLGQDLRRRIPVGEPGVQGGQPEEVPVRFLPLCVGLRLVLGDRL